MRVEHLDRTPVHVLGHARSGTSILVDSIRKHLKVSFGTESQFIVRYYRRLNQYGDLSLEWNMRRLLADVAGERCFQRWGKFGFTLDPQAVLADVREPTYSGLLCALFEQLAAHLGMDRWGDKTPEYVFDLPILDELFPDAKYIHIVRDGRDVALSLREFYNGGRNAFTAAMEWRTAVVHVRRFFETLAPDRFIEIRYEDLLNDPGDCFTRLARFLCVMNAEEVAAAIAPRLSEELRRDNSGKWKNRLSLAERNLFDELAGDLLSAYGYETKSTRVRPPKMLETLYWNADNAFKQAVDSRWWADNIYRASLRVRERSQHWRRTSSASLREPEARV